MSETAIERTRVRLRGKTHDLYGHEHLVEDDLDIAAWWEPVLASKERFQRDALNSIADSLRKIAKGQ